MSALNSQVTAIVQSGGPNNVWVPTDLAGLGNCDAVDKALQRMVHSSVLRRIDRGLYDRPGINSLSKPTTSA